MKKVFGFGLVLLFGVTLVACSSENDKSASSSEPAVEETSTTKKEEKKQYVMPTSFTSNSDGLVTIYGSSDYYTDVIYQKADGGMGTALIEDGAFEFDYPIEKDKSLALTFRKDSEEGETVAIALEKKATPPASSDNASSTPTPDASSSLGNRSNPVPLGTPHPMSGTFTDYDADGQEFSANIEVTVLSTTRGADAWNIVSAENQFNDPAPEGKEYMINRVKISMSNASSDDLKAHFSDYDFDYISGKGSSYSRVSTVIPDELGVELFNNGEAEGNICELVDVGDQPLIRFVDKFFFKTE